jgi:FkbM family methyltransferase
MIDAARRRRFSRRPSQKRMHPFNRLLRPFGFQVHRARPSTTLPKSNHLRVIEHFSIEVILDVGAHKGVSAQKLFDEGYRGKIISFEPIAEYFRILQEKSERARQRGHQWEVRQLALGDVDGTLPINVSGNGQSSSLVAMHPSHEQLNPSSKYLGQEKIAVARLDTIAEEFFTPQKRVLLLLDVQGFEPQALAGAERTLPKLTGVQLEVNFRPAYSTGFDIPTAFQTMEKHGFTPCYVEPAWGDMETSVFYQVDVLWFRVP